MIEGGVKLKFDWVNFIFEEQLSLLDLSVQRKKTLDAQIEKIELQSNTTNVFLKNKEVVYINVFDVSKYRWLVKLNYRSEINFITIFSSPMLYTDLINVESLECDCDIHAIGNYEYKHLVGVDKFYFYVNNYTLQEFYELLIEQSAKVK